MAGMAPGPASPAPPAAPSAPRPHSRLGAAHSHRPPRPRISAPRVGAPDAPRRPHQRHLRVEVQLGDTGASWFPRNTPPRRAYPPEITTLLFLRAAWARGPRVSACAAPAPDPAPALGTHPILSQRPRQESRRSELRTLTWKAAQSATSLTRTGAIPRSFSWERLTELSY